MIEPDVRHYWVQATLDGRFDVMSYALREPGQPDPDPPEVCVASFPLEGMANDYIVGVQARQRVMQA